MEIIDNRGLLLKLQHPNKVTTVIPKSNKVSTHEVLVHWGDEEVRVLRNLGIQAPAPILSKYKWPGKFKPFSHQKHTAAFFTLNKRAFCFSDMGTGKTASAIWAADYLMSIGEINRVLIVCPLSIMDAAWRDELFKCAMHRSAIVAHGAAAKRKKLIEHGTEFVIINYDGIPTVYDEIKEGGFDLIIIDEGNAYKTATTNRWKTMNSLITPDTWVWLMTGTPAAQSPTDAFGLAKLLNKNSVPRAFGRFRDMVMYKITQFKWLPKKDAKDTVFNVLQPAIRYTKEECLDLPPITYTKRDVEMTRQQKKYYKEMKDEMMIVAAGEEVTAQNAAVNINKLLQLSSGALYTDDGEILEFDITHRYKVLKEVIEEAEKKVLVFAPFRHIIEVIREKLVADGISTEVISGAVSASERTRIFKAFQDQDDPKVLVIQPQAAAHGVTLTAASVIVWWGPTSSLETYNQANARIHRSGQTHHTTVVQLRGSPAERHVYASLDNKIAVHTGIIDLYQEMLESDI
jgi:SNF2 family DNA or RNA helicase